jgi:hypothetical protein
MEIYKMGRYYSGDIEGKFWFGLQPSDDASYFGGEVYEPQTINYYFEEKHISDIEEGIKTCKEKLGDNLQKLDAFFDKNNGYNDEMLKKAGIDPSFLEWYARLRLGEQILNCVKDKGSCEFEAEC